MNQLSNLLARSKSIFLATTLVCVSHLVWANNIWLEGVDNYTRKVLFHAPPSDYDAMFESNAPWSEAAMHVSVLQTNVGFVLNTSDATLRTMFSNLKRRKIALAVEVMILPGQPHCGYGVEGFSANGSMAAMAHRIKNLGGNLAYVAMDEPLWFGHFYTGRSACRFSLEVLAKAVSRQVAAIRQFFPGLKVGDTEPFPVRRRAPDFSKVMLLWAGAYATASGSSLDFVHFDVQWNSPWRAALRRQFAAFRALKIKVGTIYNGNPGDITGLAWTHRAEERFRVVESDPRLIPDHAVLETWMPHPAHMLPESKPGTMTYLVDRYAAWKATR